MKTHFASRALALLLTFVTFFTLFTIGANAASIQDGATTASMTLGHKETILETTAGTMLRACSYKYTTDTGLSGIAYCVDHGLDFTARTLPITGKYTSSPVTAGVYANGYPSHSLAIFKQLFLSDNPILSGLTEEEYAYATQLAIWASLGQLGIQGTNFTDGRETIEQPVGDLQQERVFLAVKLLLHAGEHWDRIYKTGAYIRLKEDERGGNIEIAPDMTLEAAAANERKGIKREVINGKSYYTREYYVASATSTYYNNYNIELWADNAPAGTIFCYPNNTELPRGIFRDHSTWSTPSAHHYTSLNENGYEYWAQVKLCIPVDTVTPSGEITINMGSHVMQYELFLAYNESNTEQSYIIADPSQGSVTADAILSWGGPITENGSIEITKVDGSGNPLEGAKFVLSGTDGTTRNGTSGSNGKVLWTDLTPSPEVTYILTEVEAPAGYALANPVNLTVTAAQTTFHTVPNTTEKQLRVRKIDLQSGYSLSGVGIKFEQIDGSFSTVRYTDHAGYIQLDATALPIGSYRVYEVSARPGYELSSEVQTVNWDGKRDVDLLFKNARQKTLIIYKCDAANHYALPHATIDVYKDGQFVTTVETNDAGLAYVSDVSSGYWTCVERIPPENYELSTKTYGIHIENYDPTTTDDPRIVIENRELPTLRIVKLDRTSLRPMANIPFSVSCDGEDLGVFRSGTDGEILVTGHQGTFLVTELQSDDLHLPANAPQQIELHAGDGTKVLYFFNSLKPGAHLVKLDASDLSKPIPNAKFRFEMVDGSWGPQELTTGADGTIDLSRLPTGAMKVTEVECAGYVVDGTPRVVQLKPDEDIEFVFVNEKKPSLRLIKQSADGTALPGVTFRLTYIQDGTRYLDRISDLNGQIVWEDLEPGVVSIQETATVATHLLDEKEYHVELFPGKESTIVLQNNRRPNLTIHKNDADDGSAIPNTVYLVKAVDGSSVTEVRTGPDGSATVENLLPIAYEIIEQSVPSPYLLDAEPQIITLQPNRNADVYFKNHKAPQITITKESSITHERLPHVKYQVWYASNSTGTGELNDLGYFYTDETGTITLTGPDNGLKDGWFRVTELEPAPGYSLPEQPTQEAFVAAGKSHTFRFEDTPLSAIVVWKYDTETHAAVEGCRYTVTYLGGDTSGTGGTVIGTYTTSANGAFTVTGCQVGTYIIEEIAADADHVISDAPKTVYLSGKEQDVVQVYFGDAPKGSLQVTKVSTADNTPLSDVEFLVTTTDGAYVGSDNGRYVTDSKGSFVVSGIDPGTSLVVKEVRAKRGYLLDDTPQAVTIQAGKTSTLEFRNQPLGNLVIVKRSGADRKTPLEGVQFKLTYADGSFVDADYGTRSSNGLYWTDKNGQITLSGITGTVVATEVSSIDGYLIDENTRTQTVTIHPGDTQTLYFYNDPIGGLELIKVSAADHSQRLANVTFEVRRLDGGLVTTATTDKNGRFYVPLEDGGYYAVETQAAKSFALDNTPIYFEIKHGRTTTVKATNKPYCGIEIFKYDGTSGKGIYSASFLLYDAKHYPIGEYTSNQDGYILIDDLTEPGIYYLKELSCKGYQVTEELREIKVKAGETTRIKWANTPITGQIQVYKYAAEYNDITGTAAGAPLQGAVYEIVQVRSGAVVGQIVSDARGVAASAPLPLDRYQLREVSAPAYWRLSDQTFDVTLEYPGQIIKLADYDKPAILGVSITKRGNTELLAGSQMRYDITVANTSNVDLEGFHWHDRIPTDVANATLLTTGTYNARLNYQILYKTNYSEYQVLANNLLTTQNYSFALNAIPMQAGEIITDVYFDFGRVPAGFQSVSNPTLTVMVSPTTPNGYQLVNRADVGGKYQDVWQTAQAGWVTIIRNYAKIPTLPKTGY